MAFSWKTLLTTGTTIKVIYLLLYTSNHCPLPLCYLLQEVCRMFCHRRRRRCTCPRRPRPHRWWLAFGTHLHFWSRTSRWLWSPSCSCTTSLLRWPETLGTQGDHGVCTWQSYPWVSSQTWQAALQQRQYWIKESVSLEGCLGLFHIPIFDTPERRKCTWSHHFTYEQLLCTSDTVSLQTARQQNNRKTAQSRCSIRM